MTENIGVKTHRKLIMGRRVQQVSKNIADLLPADVKSVLDVGAGTGEMAQAIMALCPELSFSGVDVYIRPKSFIPVTKYDGNRLPFDNDSFDAVTVVDVLHHCHDPLSTLKECTRVAKKYVIIKDHISDGFFDSMTLRFMDWVGNRSHGVVLPYNYLSTHEWTTAFEAAGLEVVAQAEQLKLYPYPFDFVFGGSLHCLKLLAKRDKK